MADRADIVIVGGGAAGLATAIFAARAGTGARVVVLDGARTPGAKILVSGGSRCNVTNAVVTERDFDGGRPGIIRQILRALPVSDTIAFFAEIGVPLHEEPGGKLFPDSNRSRDVLDALLQALRESGAELRAGTRVTAIERSGAEFVVRTSTGTLPASRVVLASGGLSLPKTGSDGAGYGFARAFGHTIVEPTPALVPLVVHEGSQAIPTASLSGVSHPATLDLRTNGRLEVSLEGSLLWTHFGVSGPLALDMSRHWLRARLEERDAQLTVRLLNGHTFESLDVLLTSIGSERSRTSLERSLATLLPASVAACAVASVGIPGDTTLAHLARSDRRRLVHALIEWPLPVSDSRGYNYAEVTAGGVTLTEIDPKTMESRQCPGLYLVGEILDVDGRIGGFNFQWAWSSARVAGRALVRR
jgi:predicted Rossmann fold flavoprotein